MLEEDREDLVASEVSINIENKESPDESEKTTPSNLGSNTSFFPTALQNEQNEQNDSSVSLKKEADQGEMSTLQPAHHVVIESPSNIESLTQSVPPAQDIEISDILENRYPTIGSKRKADVSVNVPPATISKPDSEDAVIIINDFSSVEKDCKIDADTVVKKETLDSSSLHQDLNAFEYLMNRTKESTSPMNRESQNVNGKVNDKKAKLELPDGPFTVHSDPLNKPKRKPKDPKPDFKRPGSEWTIPLLSKYIHIEDTVMRLEFNKCESTSKVFEKIRLDIKERRNVLQLKGNEQSKPSETALECLGTCETDARVILDVIFLPICKFISVCVRTEDEVHSEILPNNRYDYRFYISKQCVGCLEAKGSSMNRDSVPQCILQLLLIQAEWHEEMYENCEVDAMDIPFFNVLSDGFRFVFIVLKGNKLYFEHQDEKLLKVNEAGSWENLEIITQKIIECMEKVKQSLPK
ncbi:unnamed protein product [Owenia fusiformis]|uniref:Uncharacterized protein n=1 Tax=Owenia fusiformis TaxID=6347 RepID=A0A8J1XU43_OWEFU|nr:unnamed protein product [Owenia fusiformis]